jgi:PAS domain S-box-containing protein
MWLSTARTRVLFSIFLVAAFSIYCRSLGITKPLLIYWETVAVYCLINIALIVFSEERLRSGRMRLVADLLDVVFVSWLIWVIGDFGSSLSLFYLFPIISAARYRRTLQVAGFATASYMGLVFLLGGSLSSDPAVVLRSLVFLSIAVVAGDLTKNRQFSDIKLVVALKEVMNEIISHRQEIEGVYQLILKKALEITDSDKGHIRRVYPGGSSKVVAHSGLPEGYEEQFYAFTGRYSNKAIESKRAIKISRLSKKQAKQSFSEYFEDRFPPPQSAFFVPLIAKRNEVIAVVAVYSNKYIRYSGVDEIRIQCLAPLLELAEAFAKVYELWLHESEEKEGMLRRESEEKQHRLQMLHELARHFEQGFLSKQTLRSLVDSIMERLNSEEAAIFLWEKKPGKLVKYAEASPDESVTTKLLEVEQSYCVGESLTGKSFETAQPYCDNDVPIITQYAEEYSAHLPSRMVSHIMVIPLMVGGNKIGVVRVINRKAADYDPKTSPRLNKGGFSDDDKDLLRTIGIKVAVALNSKNLLEQVETNRRYLKSAIDYSPFPTILLDERGKIKVFNHLCEDIWGVSAKDALERNVIDFYESEKEARRLGQLLDDDPDGKIDDEDATIKDATGAFIPIRLSASLVKDDEGNKLGSVGVFKDLREIQLAEEIKLNTERLETISRVMGYVSHDVKNKLLAAATDVDTLAKQARRGDLQKVGTGLVNLNDTLDLAINQLTNIALTQSFDINRPNKQLVYVERVFHECLGLWRRLAPSDISVTINEFENERYQILVDVELIQMVLTNLYDNSIDALKKRNGRSKRQIEISVEAEDLKVQIGWRDTGCGIPSRNLGRIFDVRFTTKQFGNGLGLYWAKNIVENHQGTITVDSEEGAWTQFVIGLPLRLETASKA